MMSKRYRRGASQGRSGNGNGNSSSSVGGNGSGSGSGSTGCADPINDDIGISIRQLIPGGMTLFVTNSTIPALL